jgi:hypothetical protein
MIRRLPPPVKQLLSLQNPDAYLGPPVTRLNLLFQKTHADATLKGAETGWLVLTVRITNAISMPAMSTQTDLDLHIVDCKCPDIYRASVSICDTL